MAPAQPVEINGFKTSNYNFGGSTDGTVGTGIGAGAGTAGGSMTIGGGVGVGSTIAGKGGTTSGGVITVWAGATDAGAAFLVTTGAGFAASLLLGEAVFTGATVLADVGAISFAIGASRGVGTLAGAVGSVSKRLLGADAAVSIFAECDSEYIFTPTAILPTTAIMPTAIQIGCLDFPEKLPA